VYCLTAALLAAASVSRERERATLDGLLTLPVAWGAILAAKWQGAVLRGWGLAATAGVVLLVGTVTLVIHPVSAALLAVAAAVHVGFFTCLGLWLSVSCRTTLRAVSLTALLLVTLTVGPWVALRFSEFQRGGVGAGFARELLEVGVSPVGAWYHIASPEEAVRRDYPDSWLRDGPGGVKSAAFWGMLGYGCGAALFWRLACLRLRADRAGRG
jgi:hypothetical protein